MLLSCYPITETRIFGAYMAKNWERNLQRELKNAAQKEFANWSSNDFIDHILELRQQISSLEDRLDAGDGKSAQKTQKESLTESMFKQEWSYPTKFHFLLALHQRPLTSEDLDRELLKLDSHYKDYKVPKNNLTTAINRSLKSGRIKKIKEPGIKMLYFVLPEWFDESNRLKSAYANHMKQFS